MAERDLNALLTHLQPVLDSREWAFCSVDQTFPLAIAKPLLVFHEDEGTTIVVTTSDAAHFKLTYEGAWRRITANVHSALDAVGLLAALSRALAERGIPANVVSAYHHDHLFVPANRADEAMRAIAELSAGSAKRS